ncbi:MAG: hypothetical protein QG575_1409 [Euryarchaeota archaeon]|jgi:hypothetical protein|nr:hypothetical protein [Euryarchaeota archaeon]
MLWQENTADDWYKKGTELFENYSWEESLQAMAEDWHRRRWAGYSMQINRFTWPGSWGTRSDLLRSNPAKW